MTKRFLGEAAGAVGVMLAFVALALSGAGLAAPSRLEPYPPALVSDDPAAAPEEPTTWLVDGFNVLHAILVGREGRHEWWKASVRERVIELARGFDDPRAELVVVFDGPRVPDAEKAEAPAGPRVVFAESADEWLLRAVRSAPEPWRVAVVTADRQLADRARHRGARVVGPRSFAARCGRAAAVSPGHRDARDQGDGS